MAKKVFTFFSCFVIGLSCWSQLDSTQVLTEVIISDKQLKDFDTGVIQQRITTEQIEHQSTQLTQTLRFNSLIFLRENGPGGVSSPSFRGTNASQTAVVWNGININSQFTGQTDFNTIATRNYDNLTIRSGGGSIPYGTGAVGGSVHLNNEGRFNTHLNARFSAGFSSFNTPTGHIKLDYGNKKFFINGAVDYISSENDFNYLDSDLSNENGDYNNINGNLNFGWLLGKRHTLKFFHNTFTGNRGFARTLTAVSNSFFEDRNVRNLVQWDSNWGSFESQLRLAHIFEQFRFFQSRDFRENSSIGRAIRYTANYNGTYNFNAKRSLQTLIDYTSVNGDGTSIPNSQRNTFSTTLLWKDQVTEKFQYNAQLRQDVTPDFNSPLLAGIGGSYAFAHVYTLKLQAGRNYRLPTFNDLFWAGPGGRGNPDLLPETSWQGELGHKFTFKNLNLNAQTYYIQTTNLIVWLPDDSGVFSPINVAETENYGFELGTNFKKDFGTHQVELSTQYGYTIARDIERDRRLIFVPEQKIVGTLKYQYKNFSSFYQFLYNDELFTTRDNTQTLADYAVSNLGVGYTMPTRNNTQQLEFALRGNNILNRNYQPTPFRPNPGINFSIQTTYTFN